MAILPPELHVLSSWMSEEIGEKGFKIWNIGTPSKRSLVCSILMSFLYSTNSLSVEKKLKRIINILLVESNRIGITFPVNKINVLKRRLQNFNPFKNRFSFYDDKHFVNLLKQYEIILNSLITEEIDGASHDDQLLQAASNFLNCFIDVYETDSKEQKHFFFYHPLSVINDKKGPLKRLIIFKKTIASEISSYGFGLSLKYAKPMRIEAFSYFANAAKFPTPVLNRFKSIISNDRNFLIGALNTCQDIVPFLYDLPYLAAKLPDGGLHIDPKQTDERGLSAFYYCISTFDFPLLRLLYNHASNNFDVPENNVRNPNKNILTALHEIGDTLKNDLDVLSKRSLLGDKRLTIENIFRQFICFNTVQCNIVERILLIREQIADRDLQQQHIIISIIEDYTNFFKFEEGAEHENFENYMAFSEYYDILDFFTSFLLFDNLVLLTHIVHEKNSKIYADVIRSLFLFILSHKIFHHKETRHNQSSSTFEEYESRKSQLRFIPFCYRNSFKKDLMSLHEEIKSTLEHPFNPGQDSEDIDIVRESIAGLTEIENEYFASKLKSYMNIAKNSSSVNIFSLERILQIMGEFMCCSDINNTIFKHFLCSCLPEGVEKSLCELRHHCLSHYRFNSVQGRLNLEYYRNDILMCLNNEIRDLSFILEPIIGNHFFRVREFMIERGKNESKHKFQSVFKRIQHEYKKMLGYRKINFEQNQRDYAVVSKNLFHFVYDILKQNNRENVEELEVRINAIIFLSNYICTSLRQGDKHVQELKKCCEQLDSYIKSSIESKLTLCEVKEIFINELQRLELVYSDIFLDFNERSRFDRRTVSRAFYFIKVYSVILNAFLNYVHQTKISEKQIETELEKVMSGIASSGFKMEETEIEKLINFSERLIFIDEDINIESGTKLPIIMVFKRVLENTFKRKTNTKENDLKFPLLNSIVAEMKDFDIFSIKEKMEINQKMAVYLNDSKVEIEKLAMELEKELDVVKHATKLESKKLAMDLNRKENLTIRVTQRLKYTVMSQKTIKKCVSKLFPKPKFKSAIELLKSDSDHTLSINLSNGTNALKKMFDKEIYRRMFLNIQWSKNLQLKIYNLMNQKLYFLIDRIEQLQKILIDGDEKVKHLWQHGKSSAIKQHTKVLMCQRFIRERETRSALEMLFFDCLNILEDSKLQEIWLKATNLFAGKDLRDFVSHGSPVVEVVSSYLDPKDLPLELINKILLLIEDKSAMIAISELWVSTKVTRSKELKEIIKKDDNDEYVTWRKDITICTRWEKYFNLLPLEYG